MDYFGDVLICQSAFQQKKIHLEPFEMLIHLRLMGYLIMEDAGSTNFAYFGAAAAGDLIDVSETDETRH